MLVMSLVQPRFDYSCLFWYSSCGKVIQKKLQTFQNRCIQFIENFDNRKHIDVNNFDKLNWMNVKYRIDYLTLSQVYNIVNRKCPSYMIDLIEFKSHSHCTRSGPLFVKSVQTYGKQSFSYNGSVLWNKLTRNIQMVTNKCNFKNLLKQSLLKKMHNEASREFLFY